MLTPLPCTACRCCDRCCVKEVFSVAGFFDDAAGGLVHLPALQRFAGLMDFWISSTAASRASRTTLKTLANLSGTFAPKTRPRVMS